MPSKSIPKKPTSSGGNRASKAGELKSQDLDKVTGGLKPIGGSFVGKTSTFTEDPCAGGE